MNDPYCTSKECAQSIIESNNWYKGQYEAEKEKNHQLEETIKQMGPCDRCMFNPPSSCDGKPCCMCPASKIIKEGE